jgi:hypothetical protein
MMMMMKIVTKIVRVQMELINTTYDDDTKMLTMTIPYTMDGCAILKTNAKILGMTLREDAKLYHVDQIVDTINELCVPSNRSIKASDLRKAVAKSFSEHSITFNVNPQSFGQMMTKIIETNMLQGFNITRANKYGGPVYEGLSFRPKYIQHTMPSPRYTLPTITPSPPVTPLPITSPTIIPSHNLIHLTLNPMPRHGVTIPPHLLH